MRNIVWIMILCLGVTYASAQEVYTSSGKQHYQKKGKKKGYDPDKLIIGGGLNGGISGDYINVGIAPIVGYRLTNRFSAGVGLGYQYYKFPDYVDPYYKVYYGSMNIIYPSLWSRYFFYRNFFLSATYEYDFISLKEPLDHFGNLNTTKSNVTNSCVLVGVGMKMPLGGRVSFYAELIYDVLQGTYSPYPKGSPDLHIGFAASL